MRISGVEPETFALSAQRATTAPYPRSVVLFWKLSLSGCEPG